MSTLNNEYAHAVAIIGAGPAGIYAADFLASNGVKVALINRDIKPGGLAEYGIFHNKFKMKSGLRNQFHRILQDQNITYFGNVTVGQEGDLRLEDLQRMGFSAILVTVGAQGTKWLGLPGEDLTGVYHAKDLVYHYNKLPPYSETDFVIGRKVAIIGVGNVMLDIAHWAIRDLKVDTVTAVARRGPSEVKFTKKEMQLVAKNLDLEALDEEIARVKPVMEAAGQDVEEAKAFILSALDRAQEPVSDSKLQFAFLASPRQIIGDENGRVTGLEVEETTLIAREDGSTKVQGLGTSKVLDVDTVVFAIGDKVDDTFGLPVAWNEFVKNPQPQFPVDGFSYETYDPERKTPIQGVFVAGWSREASSGLVGEARKDGRNGATAVLAYLQTLGNNLCHPLEELQTRLLQSGAKYIDKAAWLKIEAAAAQIAKDQNLPEFKFPTNEEMLAIIAR